MKPKAAKTFDTVAFFRNVKEKLAARTQGMDLAQLQEFMRQVKAGEVIISGSLTNPVKLVTCRL